MAMQCVEFESYPFDSISRQQWQQNSIVTKNMLQFLLQPAGHQTNTDQYKEQ